MCQKGVRQFTEAYVVLIKKKKSLYRRDSFKRMFALISKERKGEQFHVCLNCVDC